MAAQLDARLAGQHHMLALDADCDREDVAALARSRYPDAGWSGPEELTLTSGVHLTGPWPLDDSLRSAFDLPRWAAQTWVCFVPRERGGVLPLGLQGTDPILDAYPQAVPEGTEFETLRFLMAVARRLAGAVHLAGTPAVLLPDPQSAVDLTVYSPREFTYVDLVRVLGLTFARFDGGNEHAWSISMPAIDGDDSSGQLQVQSGPRMVPFALSGLDWADSARATEIRWHPPEAQLGRLRRAERARRAAVIREIEAIARAVLGLAGGAVVDDDGFLVAL